MNTWLTHCPGVLKRQHGQGLVEYALSLIFIAMALILALKVYGQGLLGVYSSIMSSLPTGF